ncbi:two-component system response regulator [Veronia nyctiphanis]|uniref:Two-component system response regulator n=1 Tax=Veronia nyctiphanis TaxID=1278244 RepID=A0A4Q0YPL8_9GAMM|nr:response regulator [Veronia nyctiphanis]RXJ72990.1 two-component system response regulator [Veronia nyctiphanis]
MLEGKEILIVEDDPVFSTIVAGFLNKEGCIVRTAENGLEGLRSLREAIPDLLISDLSMPVMTGLEFVEEISREYPMVPVIVISGTGGMSDVAQALRYGVKDFLIKPIEDVMTVKSSILNVLKDDKLAANANNDFSQQWFQVGNDDEKPLNEELKWHLDELLEDPESARDLLLGLMPDPVSRQGDWQLSYHSLQSADTSPIVIDYMWMIDGKLAFYVVDSSSAGKNGTATTLMIRAFFNEFLRSHQASDKNFVKLIHQIETAIKKSTYASPVKAMFGVLNAREQNLDILSAGLEATLSTEGDAKESVRIVNENGLIGAIGTNVKFIDIPLLTSKTRLTLKNTGLSSFGIELEKLCQSVG